MASEERKNEDNILTLSSPLQRNEDVESDNTQNELDLNNFSRVDDVTGHGADNVHNPMLQQLPSGVQGQQFPANQISGAQTAEGHMVPQRIGFQIAGQEIPVARGTAQAFNVPTGPSQRRYVRQQSSVAGPSYIAHPSPSTRPVQRSTIPHTYQFFPESSQAVPSPAPLVQTAPFPPQAQTAATVQTAPFPPQAQIAVFRYPLSQTTAPVQRAPFPAQAQTAAFLYPLYQPSAPVQIAPFPPQAQAAAFLYPISRTAAPTQTVRPLSPLANEFIPLHYSQGNFGQSRTSVSILPPIRLMGPAYSTVTSVERESGLVQASDAPVQSSHKRSVSQSSPVDRAVKRTNISIISESEKASVQPQAQTAARSSASRNDIAQAVVDHPIDHISHDLNQRPGPSGIPCFLCKRDLSFTPAIDGPISQPIVPPPVAVFPCDHYFHARCLETVTPVDRKTDPPCIGCILQPSSNVG